ncbi:putative CALMODULIN-BINDING PROTEIN60 [Dioscorea sansibarensis]
MATKRLQDEQDPNSDGREDKRLRKLPSFSTVLGDIVMAESLKSFCLALEPVLRRVVQEEVERGLLVHGAILFPSSPHGQLQAVETPNLKLTFMQQPSLPIFTFNKIEDEQGNNLQIQLIDTKNGQRYPPHISSPIKLELVVINGDFPGEKEDWNANEFNDNIVGAREGKRPLLIGDVNPVLKDHATTTSIQELIFTDNSSWTRSRNFRIGARVSPESYSGPRIKEAITGGFTVRDHRGELYRKRYPPRLGDKVWRLEKIGKDGAFCRKLSAANINTVQDFLKLSVVDENRLRMILGMAMSEKMWEATIKHARTCRLGEKHYFYRGSSFSIIINPICEIQGVFINGLICKLEDLIPQQRANAQIMAHEAYLNWDEVVEADSFLSGTDTAPIPSIKSSYSSSLITIIFFSREHQT